MSLVPWSVPGWTSSLCAPCPSGCVAGWSSICPWASVVLSSLRCSSLSLVGVTGCLRGPCCGLGLSWVPCPSSASLRFVPRLVARLAPSYRRVLPGAAGHKGFLVLSLVLPWLLVCFQVHLLCSASCQQVVLGLLPSPSGEASVSTCRLS